MSSAAWRRSLFYCHVLIITYASANCELMSRRCIRYTPKDIAIAVPTMLKRWLLNCEVYLFESSCLLVEVLIN